jgi:8-oxo-dGTP pyrophosphatase MutT (NUDIX family)
LSDRSGDLQYAALPYRIVGDRLEIMLITTRGQGRWLIPKGWPMPRRKPSVAASIEAMQEAGVQGVVGRKPIGEFPYSKSMPGGNDRLCVAVVYPLRVVIELPTWREMSERTRRWFSREDAAAVVQEGGLAQIIREFAPVMSEL